MTTNKQVIISDDSWTNIHSSASIAAGEAIVVQIDGPYLNSNQLTDKIVLINSTTEPTDINAGGLVLSGRYNSANCLPDSGESTFARSFSGSITARVQS